jgi:spermidine/putrescine transport system substrate-binding protein
MGETFVKKTDTAFNRRRFLQGTAVGVGILAAPAIISRKALASSGELNFTGWAGYPGMAEKVFPAFEAATGIKVNFTEQPDQDTMFAQAKLSLQTGAIDVIEPTLDRVSAWNSNGLLKPWDEGKLALGNYVTGLADGSAGERARVDGNLLFVPSVWGTEALVYNKEAFPTEYGVASLGDLFNPDNQVTLRAHSALAAMGRWLDAEGKLPKPWLDSYKDEATMRELWDIALAEAIKVKGNIVQFWTGENEAQAAFRTNGAILGMNWDSTGYNLRTEGYGYIPPKEGAIAWNQGLVQMANAVNVDQAHEFAKWVSTAEGSSLWATAFSANPVGNGGADLLAPDVSEFYKASFPGDSLSKLWWWPDQEAWFLAIRGEYADQYRGA